MPELCSKNRVKGERRRRAREDEKRKKKLYTENMLAKRSFVFEVKELSSYVPI